MDKKKPPPCPSCGVAGRANGPAPKCAPNSRCGAVRDARKPWEMSVSGSGPPRPRIGRHVARARGCRAVQTSGPALVVERPLAFRTLRPMPRQPQLECRCSCIVHEHTDGGGASVSTRSRARMLNAKAEGKTREAKRGAERRICSRAASSRHY